MIGRMSEVRKELSNKHREETQERYERGEHRGSETKD